VGTSIIRSISAQFFAGFSFFCGGRRHYLPRLLLILSSKKQMQKPPRRFEDVDRVTPYQFP